MTISSALTSVSSSASAVQLVAANTARQSVTIVNTDANRLYWAYGSTATTSAGGFTDYLDEDDSVTITGEEAELQIYGIWAADGAGAASITSVVNTPLGAAGTVSILQVLRDVSLRIGMTRPDAVFSSTTREHLELQEIANDALDTIRRAHPWRKLKQVATYTGDGSTEDFSLPGDFDWMQDSEQVWSSGLDAPLNPILDTNAWLGLDVRSQDFVVNSWIIYGGQLHIKTAMGSGVTAQHYYQSNLAVQPASGANKTAFTLDTDVFRLDEKLLKLAVIWMWKAAKGVPYAEDMASYEELKAKLIARDSGAKILKAGPARIPRGAIIAYPRAVPTS